MKIVVTILALTLILSCFAVADDTPFRIAKFAHFSCSFLDYQTTFHCSRQVSPFGETYRYDETNLITNLYWRTPPAFCAFKSVEVIAQNWLFDTIYRWSKPIAYITVAIFAIVRIVAFTENMRVMGVR